jgi:magnesium transporter
MTDFRDERPIAALLAPDILDLLNDAPDAVAAETEELHPADLADVAEALPRARVPALLAALSSERAAAVLEYLAEDLRTEVLEELTTAQAAQLVAQMTPDDRADILEELDEETADEILEAIPDEARRETEQLLAYDPETAGGLMTTQIVTVRGSTSVEGAVAEVRAIARTGRREAMNTVYVLDERGLLSGVISLRELLAAPEGALLSDVAWTEVVSILPTADRSEASRLIAEYDLVALPVVDPVGRILGMVTVDDVIDAIQEEQTESVQRFGGLEALDESYTQTGFAEMVRKRVGWLSVLFVGGMFTTLAMGRFEDELNKALVLSLFLPLIIASGGNSGSQATSLIIRALAMGELRTRDWWRVALRELPTALTLGAILGTIGVLRIIIWQYAGWADYAREGTNPELLAWTVGLALVGVVTIGSMVGAMLPFVLRRFGFDPATASAPFVATIVDVTGIVIYFSVAVLLLG